MPQFDRNSQRENRQRGNEPSFNWRGVILIVIAFSLIAMAMLFYRGGMQPVEDVPYNRFLELLENKQIVNDKNYPLQLVVEDGRPTQTLRGAYIRQGIGSAPAQPMAAAADSPTNQTAPPVIAQPVSAQSADNGFDWTAAAVGAFVASLLLILAAATVVRPRQTVRL